MNDLELSYKAEAAHWQQSYEKLLIKLSEVRELQKKRATLKSWFPKQDRDRLYRLERDLDKSIQEAHSDLVRMKQQTLFSV